MGLEDWDDESSRANEVNCNAAVLLDDMLEGKSDISSEVSLELLQDDMEDFVQDYGHDDDIERLMEKLVALRGASDEVWVTGDLADRVDQQLDGLSIINAWNEF